MSKKPNLEMTDDENPEWGEAQFKTAKKLEQMPAEFQAAVRRARGPQKAPTKQLVSMRIDGDIIEAFKSSGDGWQTRMNGALREWLQTHKA
ncbi:BrnA antitoxin family protein (plasmid) [Robbsia andropogonis]|uniref:BrnA antitoxin family protein n=1 Tax=Robbsia andropogonis TaxID=28092 RepID=UPI003D25AAC8